jgi:hypothetical protein
VCVLLFRISFLFLMFFFVPFCVSLLPSFVLSDMCVLAFRLFCGMARLFFALNSACVVPVLAEPLKVMIPITVGKVFSPVCGALHFAGQ